MTNPPITVTIDSPPPGTCPTTFDELVDEFKSLVHAEMEGEYMPYVTGAATPAVEDQDKVWHRVDTNGKPIGTYVYYSGSWRKQYTAQIGMVVMYSGDPGVDFAGDGHRGTVGGDWDGWQLCSGENGSPDLSDKFIVGAKMSDLATGYPNGDGPWKSGVTGTLTQEGGQKDFTLTDETTFRRTVDAIQMGHWQADGNSADSSGGLWGIGTSHTLLPADGNLTPDPIPTVPPFYALAYAIFQGY